MPINKIVECFCAREPSLKVALVTAIDLSDESMFSALQHGSLSDVDIPPITAVGVPDLPVLVAPRDLPKRSMNDRVGQGAFFHAICHIEFTAINLALDAALRFPSMPRDYYRDWLGIAMDEATHFSLLCSHLRKFGFQYGDFDAHDRMWRLAERTEHDLLLRMALVPRVLEARGLDVTPLMIARLKRVKDLQGAALLQRIYDDEISHVLAGTRWFNYVAENRGLDPAEAFRDVIEREFVHLPSNKLNRQGRRAAGFSERELRHLSSAD